MNAYFLAFECLSTDATTPEPENRELIASKRWPCYFFKSDTTGEKDFEEFFTDKETLDMDRFKNLGVIKNEANFSSNKLDNCIEVIDDIRSQTV